MLVLFVMTPMMEFLFLFYFKLNDITSDRLADHRVVPWLLMKENKYKFHFERNYHTAQLDKHATVDHRLKCVTLLILGFS